MAVKILFLAEKNKPFAQEAAQLVQKHFENSEIVFGDLTAPFPVSLWNKSFDYIISYASPWSIPEQILANAGVAIHFHAGPPNYPGIGSVNFALYAGEKAFGITVHHIGERVRAGNIIMVRRFPVFDNDTVYSLSKRCYAYIYVSFIQIFYLILEKKSLPKSQESWTRKSYTKKELRLLYRITKNLPAEEIKRRIRATNCPNMPGAYIELGGTRFVMDNGNEK